MTPARGHRTRLVLDFEDVFGQDPGVSQAVILPFNTCGLRADRPKRTPGTLRGNRNAAEPFDGNLDVSGPLVVPVDYTAFYYWLRAMFGWPTTEAGEGPYTHTFTVGNNQPSFILDKQFLDLGKYWKYQGCKIASMSMTLGGDGELVASFQVAAKDETPSAAAYDATPAAVAFDRLENFQGSMQEGGAAISNVVTCDFTIDFGLDTGQFVIGGSGKRGDIPEGILGITGNLTALFENHTLVDKAIAGTETSLQLAITSGAYSLTFAFDEVQYARPTTVINGPQGVNVTLPFVAFYDDDADASAVKATLVNGTGGSSSSSSSSSSS